MRQQQEGVERKDLLEILSAHVSILSLFVCMHRWGRHSIEVPLPGNFFTVMLFHLQQHQHRGQPSVVVAVRRCKVWVSSDTQQEQERCTQAPGRIHTSV